MGCVTCQNITNGHSIAVPSIHNKDSQSTVGKDGYNVVNNGPTSNESRDNQAEMMLAEINIARTQPEEYAKKVSNVIDMIHCVKNKNVLIYDDEIQLAVGRGREAFIACAQYLNTKSKKLPPLTLIHELSLPFPQGKSDMILDKNYISNELEKMNNCVEGKYEIIDFHYDISPNSIISTLLQVVDDSIGSTLQRRKNILNKRAKYVGISHGVYGDNIQCFYLVFAG